MDRSSAETIIRGYFAGNPEDVICVWLFGSLARDEPRPADIDVAVLYRHEQPARLDSPRFHAASQLEERLGAPVDLIDAARAPADLVHRVLRDGRLVVDHDPSRRIAFEVRSRNEYFDLEPIRSEYRRARGSTRDRER